MSVDRAFTGWFIPVELVQDHKLSPMEAMLWAEIYALSRRPERCTASNEHFMEQFGKSESSIQAILAKLRFKGLISDLGFDGRSRRMVANCPWAQRPSRRNATVSGPLGSRNLDPRGGENCTPEVVKTGPLEGPPYIEKKTVEVRQQEKKACDPADRERDAARLKPRNLPWEALAEIEGWKGERIPPGSWSSKIGKCVKEAKEFCPELSDHDLALEIRRRAKAYREKWPNMTITAPALLKHWIQFGEACQPNHGDDGPTLIFQADPSEKVAPKDAEAKRKRFGDILKRVGLNLPSEQ